MKRYEKDVGIWEPWIHGISIEILHKLPSPWNEQQTHLKIGFPKRKRLYSNHSFLGAMLVSGRVKNLMDFLTLYFWNLHMSTGLQGYPTSSHMKGCTTKKPYVVADFRTPWRLIKDMTNYKSTNRGEGVSEILQVISRTNSGKNKNISKNAVFLVQLRVANVMFFTFVSDEQVAAVMGTYGGSSQGVTFIITMVT